MKARHPQQAQPAHTPVGLAVAVMVATTAALWAAPAPLWALPQDAVVTLGQVVVRPLVGNTLEIVQASNRAALDWRTFSIAAGERLLVRQPDAAAVLFNRVTGADPSLIFGQLQANGRVFLSNPRGIVFGAGAQVDVGGLVATTLAVNTTTLVNGNYQLAGAAANTGTLQMDGSIRAPAGTVVLVGPSLSVGGTVQASRVGLAAAAAVQVDVDGDGLIFFNLRNDTLAARLSLLPGAELRAGSAELRALARSGFADTVLNLDGVVRARGLGLRDGQVVIDGGSAGFTRISGQVQADNSSTGRGGDVVVLGDKLLISSSAVLDASGQSGGGSVRVGGDLQGGNAAQLPNTTQAPSPATQALPPASQVLVQPGARLLADATRLGDGGRVIVWSDTATRFAGAASVRGGPLGGDGGLVEVSSKGLLGMTGSADRQAPLGRPGRLLLDPLDLEVGATADVNGDATAGDDLAGASLLFADRAGAASQITAAQVKALLAGGNVTLQASNNLRVTSAITAGGAGDFALTLQAGNNLVVDAPISLAGTGKALTLHSNASTGITLTPANPAGVVTLNSPIRADGALIISNGVGGTGQHQFNAALTGASLQLTGGVQLSGSNTWTLAGNSTLASVLADGASAGQLLKAGAGVLTLAGANSYSGGTRVLAGSLVLQGGAALVGSGAVSVAAGARLQLDADQTIGALAGAGQVLLGSNTLTLGGGDSSGSFSGTLDGSSGGLTKIGTGSQTLAGASNYSGATLVAAGTLATSAASLLPSSSAVTVAGGATLVLGGSQTLASLAGAGTLALGANPLWVGDGNNSVFSGSLTGSGSLAKQGSGTLVLSGDNTAFSGPLAVLTGVLQAQRSGALGSGAASVSSGAALELSGGISLANAIDLAGVGINDGTADRGALRSTGGNNTLTGPITLAAEARINADADTLRLASGSAWSGAGFSINLGGTGNVVVADAINTGSGALRIDGAGTVSLAGANSYSGGTRVLAGSLVLQGGAALVGSGAVSVAAGARLQLDADQTIGALAGAGQVLLGSNTLTLGGGDSSGSFSGTLDGSSGGLTKIGTGSQTLAGASNYSGATLVAAGTLATSAASLLPSSSAVTVAGGATLVLGGSQTLASLAGAGTLVLGANPLWVGDGNNSVFSGSLTGSGSLAKQGSGTLVLSGDNTAFSGPLAVLTGVLQAQRSGALGSGAASVSSGAALELSGGISLANAIDLAGVGINDGTADRGALRSTGGNNTLTGPITLAAEARINADAGSLTLASGQALAAGPTTLTFGGAGNAHLADVLAGAPTAGNTLRKDGSGMLTLGAANLYSGATQVSGGTLATSGAGRLPSSSLLTVDAGASLVLGSDQTLATLAGAGTVALGPHSLAVGAGTFSGDFTGTGALAKQGGGLLVLAGNSPGYSGPITVQAGVLRAQAGGALGSTAAATTVVSGAALELAGDITLAEPLNLGGSGVGGVVDSGALRNTSGNNTLTGAISLTADARINSDAGTLLLALPAGTTLLGTGRNLNVGGAAATSVGAALVLGSGTLVKDGAGTLTLSASAGNTSSLGATLVNAGTLATAAANLLPGSSAVTVAAGATLQLGGSQVLDNLAGTGTVALGAGTLTLGAAGGNSSFGGSFSGSASWLKQGGGILTLTGSSPGFSGSTTVLAGVLQVQTSQALGNAAASTTVQPGATLALAGGITLDMPLTLAGSGVLGAGALRSLAGNNTVAGTITLAGTARINTDAGSLSLGRAGSDALAGAGQTVQLGGAGAINVLGVINTGSGGLLMDGSSTLTLAAASNYTGATQINSGSVLTTAVDSLPTGTALALGSGATLTLGGAQTLGSLAGAGTLVLGAQALALGDGSSSSFSGTLSGSGAMTKQGTGSLTLASAQPLFSGPTTVLAGTLVLGHSSALAGSVVSLANQAGATLDLGANASINALAGGGVLGGVVNLHGFTLNVGGNGSSSQFSGALMGVGGGLTKLGSGTLTLAGASSYSGSTLVSAGTLVAANAAALGSAAQGSSVASGAALEISSVDIGAEPLRLAGSGPAGAGALLGTGLAAAASGPITLAANSQIGASGRLRLAGVISDAGQGFGVTKAGVGALVLTGASSYSGGTQVAGGALVLAGAAARAGTGTIAVGANRLDLDQGAVLAQPVSINGGTLGNGDGLGGGSGTGTLASTGSLLLLGDGLLQAGGAGLQINAVISQAGGARGVVVGGGKVTLTAANSYSGGTRLTGGTLVLDGALASAGSGAISVAANRLQLDHGAVLTNTLTVAGGTLASGVGGGSVGGSVGGSASITLLGDATLQAGADGLLVNAPIGESGGARRLDFAGGTITLRAANTSSGGGTLLAGTLVLDGPSASAGSGTLALGANRLQVDNGARISQPISVAGGSLVNTAGSATLASTARLTLLGDATLAVTGSGTGWLLDGVVDQAGGGNPPGLTINAGSASVSLTSASSYSGGTTLQSGTLLLSGAVARPGTGTLAIGANRLVLNDGALLDQAVTLGAGTLDNTRGSGTLGRGATLVLQGDATLQTSGSGLQVLAPISQTGGPQALVLAASSGASITLGGANTYSGGTLLAAGTLLLQGGAALADNATLTLANSAGVRLQLQADETLGALAGGGAAGGNVLLDGHTLAIGASGASSRFAGVLQDGTAPGSLVKQGAGSLALAGANTLTGSSTVAAGSLVLDQPAALANSAVVLAGGTGAQLLLAGPARIGSLAGGGGVAAGAGALQGSVLLGAHNLTVGADGSSTTFAGVISGSGGLAKLGAGVLTLTGANTLTGTTSVAGGSLLLGQADVLAASAVNLAGGGLGLLADSRIGSLAGTGPVSLGGFQLAAGGDQRSTSFAGVISGAGSLRKEGSGTLSLSGANQIDGSLLISAGTLALQAGAALAGRTSVTLADVAGATLALQADATIAALAGGGAAGGQVLLGSVGGGVASLTVGGTGGGMGTTSQFDGQLSGPGQLIQQGAGVLTLGGINSHSGGTRVAQGTLAVLADSGLGASGAAVLLDGGTLRADADITLAANRPVTVGAAGGSINSNSHHITLAGPLTGAGNLSKLGAGSLLLLASSPSTGATQVQAGSLLLGAGGALPNSAVQLAGRSDVVLGLLADAAIGSLAGADGSGSNGGGVATVDLGSHVLRTGADGRSTSFAGTISGAGGVVKQGSGSFALAGSNSFTGALQVDAGTLLLQHVDALAPAVALRLADAPGVLLQLAADQTIGALAGGGAGGGNVALAAFNLRTGGNGDDSSFAGVISGSGGLVKQGSGRFTLSRNNSFSGPVLLEAGTLALQAGQALAPGVAVRLLDAAVDAPVGLATSAPGPTLALLADQTIGSLAGGAGPGSSGGQVALGGFSLRTGGDGSNTSFAGTISGSGGLIKQGAGSFTLSGSNLFTGPLQVAAGVVVVQGGAALADSVPVQLANSPGVALALQADETIGALSGGGAAGGVVLLGKHTLAVGGNASSSQFDGVISGSGGLRKVGAGTLTLAGANTFSGATTVQAGTLALQGGAALADSSAVTLGDSTSASAATLQLLDNETLGSLAGGGVGGTSTGKVLLGTHTLRTGANNSSSQFGGVISGDGQLIKLGSGQFTLAGANFLTGNIQVLAGTLATSGQQRLLASSQLQVANNATLLLGGDETVAAVLDLAGQAADGSARLNIGNHTLTIDTPAGAGTAVFSGALLAQGGRLVKLGDGVLQLGGTAVGGGLLQVDQGVLLSVGGSALSADTVVQVAAGGTLQLAGAATVLSLALHGSLSGAGLLTITGLTALDSGLVASPLATGSLTSQGNSQLAAPVLVAGTSTVAGGSLTLVGGGLLQSPSIQINSGATLASGAAGSLGTGTALQVASGGRLQLGGAETAASLALAGSLVGNAAATGTLDLSGAATLAGGSVAAPLRSRSLSSQGASSLNAAVWATEQATLVSGTLDLGANATLHSPLLTLSAGSLATTAAHSLAGVDTLVVAAPASLRLGADDTVASLRLAGTLGRVGGDAAAGAAADGMDSAASTQLRATTSTLLDGGQVLAGLATPLLVSQGNSLLAAPVLASSSTTLASGSLSINSSGLLTTPLLQLQAGSSLYSSAAQRLGAGTSVQMAAGSQWWLGGDQTLAGLADLPGTDTAAANPAQISLGSASLSMGSGGADLAFSGLLSGAGSLVKQGAGQLLLLRDQAYGDTRIDAGALQLGDGGQAGSLGSGSVNNQGVLRLQRADDVLLANAISGSGSLQQAGSGSLTLSNPANRYTGNTEVLSGLLRTSAAERLPDASTVTVASGARLVLAGNETLGALLADGPVALAGSVTSTTGDQRYRAAVLLELPLDTAQPITLSAPGHTVLAQDDGNRWGRLPLSVNAGQLLLSAGRSADGPAGALVYRDLTLGAITLTGLEAGTATSAGAVANLNTSSIDAGLLRLGALVPTGQAASGDARSDGLLRQDAGTLLLRAHASPGYSALVVAAGEGTPVDPLKGRQLFVADDVISQSANSQVLTQPGSTLQLLAPAGGSISLGETRNRLAGSVAALSGAAWASPWVALDVSAGPAGGQGTGQSGGLSTGQSRITLAGSVLQVGGRGLEADLLRLSAGQLGTDVGSVITARLWYNDAAAGLRSSTPGLRLTLLPEAFANPLGFGTPGQGLQVSVGNRNPGSGVVGDAGQPLREGLSAGFVQVLPRAGAKGSTVVYLAGPQVGLQGYSFFHDGAGQLLELPVFYNGVLPVTPQLAGSLAAVAAVSETARRDGFDEAVRTENVAIRLRAGVIAEVGPGRPATVGSAGLRPPASCAVGDGDMVCASPNSPATPAKP